MTKEYRKCVGMMILNPKKEILVGKRLDHPSGFWQMPQGGIDNYEIPEEAVWREMMEEIGTNNASLIKSSPLFIFCRTSSAFDFASSLIIFAIRRALLRLASSSSFSGAWIVEIIICLTLYKTGLENFSLFEL